LDNNQELSYLCHLLLQVVEVKGLPQGTIWIEDILIDITEIVVDQEGKKIHLVAQPQNPMFQIQLWTINSRSYIRKDN
jgi:hypothetical protein